jgi:P27 family predicted phage terminase small subunit
MPRPAKATHLHVLEGTLRTTRHRHRQHEPKPQGNLIDPPAWMDDEHQAVWREQLRATPVGLLKGTDAAVMTVWTCAAVAHARAARHLSSGGPDSGVVVPTRDGNPIVDPFFGVMNRQATIVIRSGNELGFSPAARTRISTDGSGAAPSDPADEFFS